MLEAFKKLFKTEEDVGSYTAGKTDISDGTKAILEAMKSQQDMDASEEDKKGDEEGADKTPGNNEQIH